MLQDFNNPWWYVTKAIILLLALPAHEACHALMAWWLGDDTAKHQGRISLNPLHHLDPWGTILLLIPGSFIGWAKPTPFNPLRLRGNRSLGSALIYLAGPFSNLLQAGLFSLVFRILLLAGVKPDQKVFFEFQVAKAVTEAQNTTRPRYPDALKKAGVEGEVMTQYVVNQDGTPMEGSLKVLKAADPQFIQAVKDAFPNMRFTPAEVEGRKVKQLVQQPFQFSLNR